ncbi:hypothetical protein EHF33_02080 [Deinococcus psychrotolerans]|uniref:Uncharacterized protein n=1 Tax=Deinococcus psychrotolerans TaxID=2489213 RepID=A0A3G8Y9U6_9DEIO|nr:hypothetical protein [Deinococcus psychrotolerans]AZI41683.1 hypothetical protein EHF33_02080 [Deinococcus psychrotolerans]
MHLISRLLALWIFSSAGTVAAAQSISPLNAAEVAAILGQFEAVSVSAPVGTKRAIIAATSQMNGTDQSGLYTGTRTLSIYDFKAPVRLIVGLAGDPILRGKNEPTLSLPGLSPCGPEEQLALLGASSSSETNLAKQCLGMGNRAEGIGGGKELMLKQLPRLNAWKPFYRWYFLVGNDSSEAAYTEARNNPAAQIVWWVYFSSDASSEVGKPPLYTPNP